MKDILEELNNKSYINDLDEKYEIRFCKRGEGEEVLQFIKEYWRSDHIFVKSRKLFDWQHLDENNDRYNFVIAKEKNSKEIHSILGFLPTYQFDENISNTMVWPCIWKSREDIKVKGLGVALYYYLKTNIDIETISILGISEVALSIYKHWNFETGKINHFYILNSNIDNYKLIEKKQGFKETRNISNTNKKKIKEYTMSTFKEVYDNIKFKGSKYKSKDYYINRYFKHPIYLYKCYGIIDENDVLESLMITRVSETNESKCLRIVDFIGLENSFIESESALQNLMNLYNFEYIDFLNVGLNEEELKRGGFNKKKEEEIIIPNYFEPYILKNIELDYAIKSIDKETKSIFFKGDSDQDRPNYID